MILTMSLLKCSFFLISYSFEAVNLHSSPYNKTYKSDIDLYSFPDM